MPNERYAGGRGTFRARAAAFTALATMGTFSFGQQNFFNVPSSEITPKGKLFFQEQLNVAERHQQSSTTVDLGLGHGFEAGLNCAGLTILEDREAHPIFNDSILPYNPFILANAQERFELGEGMAIALGAQYGMTSTTHMKDGGMVYCNFVYGSEDGGLKVVAGPYYASKSYFGEGSRLFNEFVGLQAGVEKSIILERLAFQTDFISGEHDLGEIVPGGAYYVTRHWILSAGYQIPTFGSSSIRSLVFELTYSPSDR
jgi:hypothetical protein